ncbi:hypothetical protein, partial [Nocardia puris]|uniref:hypothetical protein n=1 Tax=Nocardia puris TaxID=208602 RepID=UPI001E4FCBE3
MVWVNLVTGLSALEFLGWIADHVILELATGWRTVELNDDGSWHRVKQLPELVRPEEIMSYAQLLSLSGIPTGDKWEILRR